MPTNFQNDLFPNAGYILPGQDPVYAQLVNSLHADLTPATTLEFILVEEICRVSWRLRRCIMEEAALIAITDPERVAKLQLNIDRTRTFYHRLLHKCHAELRKLQTERQFRAESTTPGTDFSGYGLANFQSIRNDITRQNAIETRRRRTELDIFLTSPVPAFDPAPVPDSSNLASFCKKAESPGTTPSANAA